MKVRIERRYLVQRVETWEILAVDGASVQHFIDTHTEDFDSDVTMFGERLNDEDEEIPYDQAELHHVLIGEIVEENPEPENEARIIQFPRRDDDA